MNNKGFSLVEILVAALIFTIIAAGVFMTMKTGQDAWRQDDIRIQLQDSMRQAVERMSAEIRLTGSYSDDAISCPPNHNTILYISVLNAAGANNTDVIRFSVPVVCQAGASVMNISGDVNYWRAPLTWGCNDSACMDADDDCATNDYNQVEYRVDANNQLLRNVLASDLSVVRTDIFAQDVTDFQAQLNTVDICQAGQGLTTSNAINIDIELSRNFIESDNQSRLVEVNDSVEILFRNLGEDVL